MAAEQVNRQPLQVAAATTRTCAGCGLSVVQQAGTRRTMCPGCGQFYDKQAAQQVKLSHNNAYKDTDDIRERIEHIRKQNEAQTAKEPSSSVTAASAKPGGKLQSISNFFQNLGPKKAKPTEPSPPPRSGSSDLPPITSPRPGAATPAAPTDDKARRAATPAAATGGVASSLRLPVAELRALSTTDLRNMYKDVKDGGGADWSSLTAYYVGLFQSTASVNAAFKEPNSGASGDDPSINMDLMTTSYEILLKAPEEVHKAAMKATIDCLLDEKNTKSTEVLRAYVILAQNPLFQYSKSYIIFAHLMRRIARLSPPDVKTIVTWFSKMGSGQFRGVITRVNSFLTCRLKPSRPDELPPMSKCLWWIPCCAKVMALLNAANETARPRIVPRKEFYNPTLNELDLFADYCSWQLGFSAADAHMDGNGFTFCHYPFLLTMPAKRFIMQKDSEHQMIVQARKSLVEKVQQNQMPDMGSLFLEITVRRNKLVMDSLKGISQKKGELKKKLKITFDGEPGLDMGGLTKEWFMLLVKQIFSPKFGLFAYNQKAGSYWFSFNKDDRKLNEFNLAGALMGLAVYNSINLDVGFPACVYRKLLSPAVAPFGNPKAIMGVDGTATLDDLACIMPEVASSLKELLDYEGDVEGDMCMTFQASVEQLGTTYSEALKKGGESVAVTRANREEFVKLYVDWVINRAVYVQFRAFYMGFHSVCASNAMLLLQPDEVEVLVCGSSDLDMVELRKVTTYDGYRGSDQVVHDFWDVLLGLPIDMQRRFLLFVTGSDRLPVGGMAEMKFKISRINDPNMLPVAHTCFNHLVLPAYKSKKALRQKLLLAVQNTEGFGLE